MYKCHIPKCFIQIVWKCWLFLSITSYANVQWILLNGIGWRCDFCVLYFKYEGAVFLADDLWNEKLGENKWFSCCCCCYYYISLLLLLHSDITTHHFVLYIKVYKFNISFIARIIICLYILSECLDRRYATSSFFMAGWNSVIYLTGTILLPFGNFFKELLIFAKILFMAMEWRIVFKNWLRFCLAVRRFYMLL